MQEKKFLIAIKADFSNKDLDHISTCEPTTQPATEPQVTAKAKTKCKISPLKLCNEFLNEIKNE